MEEVGQSIISILLFQEIFLYCPKTYKNKCSEAERISSMKISYPTLWLNPFYFLPSPIPLQDYTQTFPWNLFFIQSLSHPLLPFSLSLSLTLRAQHSRQEVDAGLTLAWGWKGPCESCEKEMNSAASSPPVIKNCRKDASLTSGSRPGGQWLPSLWDSLKHNNIN